MSRWLLAVVALGLFTADAEAQAPAPRSVRAHRLAGDERVRVDGRMDEAAWGAAPRATGFVQSAPTPGAPSTEPTEVAVLYDDDALYVGVRAYARDPSTLVRRLVRRDGFGDLSDRVYIEVGSPADGRTAFSFGVNLAGAQQDVVLANDQNDGDATWDGVWDSAVRPFSDVDGTGGYVVEVRIPFSQLRFDPSNGRPWQFNVQRDVGATGEVAYWSPISPEADGYVSQFGVLTGLEGLQAPRRAEVLPYVATRLTREPGSVDDPFYDENALSPRVGLDAQIGVTSGLTLTATINPDFGQVEADPAVVNLSQFETFFAERRPFFVEGTEVFSFGGTRGRAAAERPTFFYSRRIGGQPSSFRAVYGDSVSADGPDGDPVRDRVFWTDVPEQTTIAGAAKLSGQAGPWTVGLLEAVTTDEDAEFVTEGGFRSRLPVAPLANYLVGRAQRNGRGGRTVVGGFLSSVIRDTRTEAFGPLLAATATVGGVDLETATASRAWTLSAVAAGSVVTGDADAITALQRAPQRYYQRPNTGYLTVDPDAESLRGYRVETALAKTGGGPHWRGSLTLGATSPGFEVNDLGYQERADILSADWNVSYNEPRPGASFLNYAQVFAYGAQGVNYGRDHVLQNFNLGTYVQFSNLWGAQVIATGRPAYKNDRVTRGGPLTERPPDGSLSLYLASNSARRLSGTLTLAGRRELPHSYAGVGNEWTVLVRPRISYRPTDALALSFEPEWTRLYNTDFFIYRAAAEAGAPGEIGGALNAFQDYRLESLGLGLRADWAFTPDLTLQLVAVPKVDALEFGSVRALAEAGSYDFVPLGGDGVADYTLLSLRGNAVLRWEWRPGSTVYAVWQQVRDEYDVFQSLDVLGDFGNVFGADVTNVFLIKASYWFGL